MQLFTAWIWIDQEEFQKYGTAGGRMEPWIFWEEMSIPPHSINTRPAHWLNTCSSSAALAGCCRACACSMWTLLWGASGCGDLTGLDAKHRLYANSLLCYEKRTQCNTATLYGSLTEIPWSCWEHMFLWFCPISPPHLSWLILNTISKFLKN